MEESMLLNLGLSLLSQVFGNAINSGLSRGDFAYSHSLTNIPAQVRQMKDAGLNPALVYGQISAPQGQSLGNYQSDFLEGLRDIENSRQARAETAHREAETDLLKAQKDYLVMKSRNEALMGSFDLDHQPERYALEIEGKGLVNAGQDLKNQGYQLDNKGKLIQNEILGLQRDIEEFNKKMKEIDASKHKDFVDAEISRIVAMTHLAFKEAWALGKKVPAEVGNLESLTRKVIEEVRQMRLNGRLSRDAIKASTAFQELQNAYYEWLGRDPRVRSMIEHSSSQLANLLVNLFVTPSY